jgi:tRNA nucleotidyltransferase (CCA-adding enzyme)
VARFASIFTDFSIAPETISFCKSVVKLPEFKLISTERVFKELATVLMTSEKPSIFFNILREFDGLDFFFSELKQLIDVPQRAEYHPEGCAWTHTMMVLDYSAKFKDVRIKYAALVHDFGKGITPSDKLPGHPGHETFGLPLVLNFGIRLNVPNEWTEAAIVVTKYHLLVHRLNEMKAKTIIKIFYEIDAFRKPDLVTILARACETDEMGKRKNIEFEKYNNGIMLENYFESIKDIGFKDIRSGLIGEAIGNEIRAERVRTLKRYLSNMKK